MVSATGIGSGLDIEGLVTQLVAAEREPTEARLNSKEAGLSAELSAFGQFKSSLNSVESALSGLSSLSTFREMLGTSGDEESIGVTAGISATPANYNISVSQLAQAHSLAGPAVSSLEESIGTGTITIRFGTTDYTSADPGPEAYNGFTLNPESDTLSIEIDETNNTLEGIRDAINAANGNVDAVIVNDGDGYRLLLNSATEGAENSMQISVEDTGDLNNSDTSGLSILAFDGTATNLQQTIAAQDALFTVNGLSITSGSNTVTETLEGVTLDLAAVTETDVSLSIERDTGSITEAVNEFITAYNSFTDTVSALAGYDATAGVGGLLQGDFTVRSIEGRLRQLIAGTVESSSGEYSYLAQVGITTAADGKLQLNESLLNEAIQENPEALEDLFAAVGRPTNPSVKYIGDSDDTVVGDYAVFITQAAARAEILGINIGFPLTIDADNDNFVMAINGESSESISLTQGTYTSGEDLAAELQSRINGEDRLAELNYRVSVDFSAGAFEIRSEEYGSEISLEIISADTNFSSSLGLTVGLLSEGMDVVGSIGGQSATGIGQSLVADDGTNADGMSLIIESDQIGSLGTISYTRGLADQLKTLVGLYLDSDGIIDSRTTSLDAQIEDIDDDREALERRIESIEIRYRAEFNTLDALLASLNTTSGFLTTQLANLPGPRDPNS